MSKVNARMGTSKENPDVSEMNTGFKVSFIVSLILDADLHNHHFRKPFHYAYPFLKCAGEASPAQGGSTLERMTLPYKNPL